MFILHAIIRERLLLFFYDFCMCRFAKLMYPKGLGFTVDGELVFVDGTAVRVLRRSGALDTLAGTLKLPGEWRPQPCGAHRSAQLANLNWPTQLAVNLAENTIGVLDDGAVLEIDLRYTTKRKD